MNMDVMGVREVSPGYEFVAENPAVPVGYKKTEVGVIPEDWEVRRLHDVAQIRSGIAKNAGASVADPISVYYLRVANVQDGYLDLSEMSRITISRSDLSRFSVVPGDVLMNEGGDRDKLGRGAIWRGQLQPCIHQNHVFVVRCNQLVIPEYITLWAGGAEARKYFLIAGNQSTNLASINKTALGGLPVVIPPKPEQRAIATALSEVDALLEELDRLIAKKRDIKQAAMQQLLTGETRLPGFEGEWHAKRLGDIAELHRLNVVPANQPEQLFVHFSLPAFDEGQTATVELGASIGSNKFRVPQTSVLVSKLNPRIPRIWMPEVIPPNSCASTEWLILTPQEGVERMFLYVLCSSQAFCQQMEMAATGTTGSHQRISSSMALDIQVRVPVDREEQTIIAKVLSDMDAEIQALEHRRSKTAELKQGMMQELLTGRTRLV